MAVMPAEQTKEIHFSIRYNTTPAQDFSLRGIKTQIPTFSSLFLCMFVINGHSSFS